MPTKHARCSASAAHRWINCPGSVALSDQCPDPGTSSYADEGTLAHSLAELKLRHALKELTTGQYKKKLAKIQQSDYYNAEMDEATDFYVDAVLEEFAAADEGAELMIEQQLSLEQWIPEGFGTSDVVIVSNTQIQVIDLKYGKGVKVEAKNNPQLRLYGLGAAVLFGSVYDFDTVKTTVIQPRLDHVDSEVVILKELLLWGEKEVAPRAIMAMEGTDYMAAGDWCRFCPAKTRCRKRAEFNLELARMEFQKPPLLSDEEIGEVLAKADHLQKWAEEVNQYALEQALAGKHFEGWKLVEGRSIRKYADETKVASTLMAAGFDEAMLYQRKLNGITEMEKLVGKKKLAATLGDLLIKPAGKPVLVPESDKREAINTTEAAKADFTNTDDEIASF